MQSHMVDWFTWPTQLLICCKYNWLLLSIEQFQRAVCRLIASVVFCFADDTKKCSNNDILRIHWSSPGLKGTAKRNAVNLYKFIMISCNRLKYKVTIGLWSAFQMTWLQSQHEKEIRWKMCNDYDLNHFFVAIETSLWASPLLVASIYCSVRC